MQDFSNDVLIEDGDNFSVFMGYLDVNGNKLGKGWVIGIVKKTHRIKRPPLSTRYWALHFYREASQRSLATLNVFWVA